jgi:hypothetical protein
LIETTGEVCLDEREFGILQRPARHSPAVTPFPRHADAAGLPETVSRGKIGSKAKAIWRMSVEMTASISCASVMERSSGTTFGCSHDHNQESGPSDVPLWDG